MDRSVSVGNPGAQSTDTLGWRKCSGFATTEVETGVSKRGDDSDANEKEQEWGPRCPVAEGTLPCKRIVTSRPSLDHR